MQTVRLRFVATLLAAMAAALTPAFAQSSDPVVFAAASLKNALDDAAAEWTRQSGKRVSISYGASSTLAKQIEAGAPAQMFLSADPDWMNYLADKNLIRPETRSNLLGNRIVLVASKDSSVSIRVWPSFPLANALGGGKLAMANTDSEPAGKSGKAALQALGVWNSVRNSIAQAQDARAALALVARKEAPLGIVYATDAVAEPNVKTVGTFAIQPPIIYPVALTAKASDLDVATFLAFLKSPAARPAFEKEGFTVLRTGDPGVAQDKSIVVASTTSTQDSGLFDHILPLFKAKTGIEVNVVALGTGQALDTARRGEADVVFVHARQQEEKFVEEGFGVKRFDVMHNDFVLIGPKSDPASIAGSKDILAALSAIARSWAPFISRGDRSGTHEAELALWKEAGIDPSPYKGAWYREVGRGMEAALNVASKQNAYVLADRGTWIAFKNRGDLAIAVEGDWHLFNQYGVILVNPAKYPQVKTQEGQRFIDWLVSRDGQQAIESYKVEDQQLFFPDAAPTQ